MSEHFDGTLHDMLLAQSGKIIPEAILRKYVFQILEGLSYLNKEGIVHRNLHLQNILVDSEVWMVSFECRVKCESDPMLLNFISTLGKCQAGRLWVILDD
jgi:serine/threonine protein kinase